MSVISFIYLKVEFVIPQIKKFKVCCGRKMNYTKFIFDIVFNQVYHFLKVLLFQNTNSYILNFF